MKKEERDSEGKEEKSGIDKPGERVTTSRMVFRAVYEPANTVEKGLGGSMFVASRKVIGCRGEISGTSIRRK